MKWLTYSWTTLHMPIFDDFLTSPGAVLGDELTTTMDTAAARLGTEQADKRLLQVEHLFHSRIGISSFENSSITARLI